MSLRNVQDLQNHGMRQSDRITELERALRLVRDQIEIEQADGKDTPALRVMMRDIHAAIGS